MTMPTADAKRSHLRRLQREIDKLATLVFEAKNQADKVQQVADALGDSAFGELGPDDEMSNEFSPLVFPEGRRLRKERSAIAGQDRRT